MRAHNALRLSTEICFILRLATLNKLEQLFYPNMPIQKSVFMARLKDGTSVMFLITAGRAFHSRCAATEQALSTKVVKVVLVRGCHIRSSLRNKSNDNDEIDVVVSVRCEGRVPL